MDVASLAISVDSRPVREATKDIERLANAGTNLESITRKLIAAWGAWQVGDYLKNTVMLAARFETLGVVMGQVGRHIGSTSAQMDGFAQSLQKTGISMQESRNTLIQMASAQMDLSKSAALARIAQDAAVIGNINSSEAFQRMIYGIRSGQTEVLRTIGINVQFDESYRRLAISLNKTVDRLTDLEKRTARTNEVVKYGKQIAGAYEASMQTMGKQMLSAQRYAEDLATSIGMILEPIAKLVISPALGWLESASKKMKLFVESADGRKFIDNIVNPIAALLQVLGNAVMWFGKLILSLTQSKELMLMLAALAGGAVVMALAAKTAALLAAAKAAILAMGANAALTVSMGALVLSSVLLAAALGAIYIGMKGVREETAALEEATRKQEERQQNIVKPLAEQRAIVKELRQNNKEMADALKGGAGEKQIAVLKQEQELRSKIRKESERLKAAGATPDDIKQQEYYMREQAKAEKERDGLQENTKKREDQLKREMELRKASVEEIRKSLIEFEKERIAYTEGASAAYVYGLRKKMYNEEEARTANSQRVIRLAWKEQKKVAEEAEDIAARSVYTEKVLAMIREGQTPALAREIATKQAINASNRDYVKLEEELVTVLRGEAEAYLDAERKKGTPEDMARRNIALKQETEFLSLMRKHQIEMTKAREGEIAALRLQLDLEGKLSEIQKTFVLLNSMDAAHSSAKTSNGDELTEIFRGPAAAKLMRNTRTMGAPNAADIDQQDRNIRVLREYTKTAELAVIAMKKEDLLHNNLELSIDKQTEALRKLNVEEMRLKGQAGDDWAAMGTIIADYSGRATDAMVNWISTIGQASSAWVGLRDTVKSMINDIIKDMQRAIMQKYLMGPLFESMGLGLSGYGSTLGTRAGGGPVSGGTSYLVGEKGPEIFTPSTGGKITKNSDIGGGGPISVSVSVDANGVSSRADGNHKDNMGQLGMLMGGAVKKILIDEQRPGGLLYGR